MLGNLYGSSVKQLFAPCATVAITPHLCDHTSSWALIKVLAHLYSTSLTNLIAKAYTFSSSGCWPIFFFLAPL